MKTAASLLLLACLVLLPGCQTPAAGLASRLAMAHTIPGWHAQDQCLPYAAALAARLRVAGAEARVLGLRYEPGPRGELRPGHAIVLFRAAGEKHLWAMDNMSFSPTAIPDRGDDLRKARYWHASQGGTPWDVLAAW